QTQSVLFAEPLFAILFALAVVVTDAPPVRWRPGTAALAAGILAALALLTRTIGISSGVGAVGFLLLVRRAPSRLAALAAAPGGVAVLGWATWTLVHAGGIDPALAINYGS